MKRLYRLALILVLMLIATSALAKDVIWDLKKIKLGDTIADVLKIYPNARIKSSREPRKGSFTVPRFKSEARIKFPSHSGRFKDILTVNFLPKDLGGGVYSISYEKNFNKSGVSQNVRDLFTQKYGTPNGIVKYSGGHETWRWGGLYYVPEKLRTLTGLSKAKRALAIEFARLESLQYPRIQADFKHNLKVMLIAEDQKLKIKKYDKDMELKFGRNNDVRNDKDNDVSL